MPITVTKTIGATGRDYATINDFFAAIPADLVALDELWEGVIYPDSGNTITAPGGGFVLGARTTDVTRCVRLKCAAGASFKDHANKLTNALRANSSNGILLTKSSYGQTMSIGADLELIGLQIEHTATGSGVNVAVTYDKRLTLRDSIIQSVDRCMNGMVAGSEPRLYNSLLISSLSGGCRSAGGGTVTGIAKGCTFVANASAGYPIRMEWRPVLIKDCAYFGMSAAPYGTSYTGSTNNATDQTSFPAGVTGTHSLTQANQFEVVNFAGGTNDFRVKAGSDLIGAGVADADISTDIIGTTRADPPTIGAWDYAAAAPVSIEGTASITEGADAASSSGSVGDAGAGGTAAIIDGADNVTSSGSIGVVGGTVTSDVFRNNTASPLANTTISKVVLIKVSDLSAISFLYQTTGADGTLAITSPAIVAGTPYLLVSSNADGTARGVSLVVAA